MYASLVTVFHDGVNNLLGMSFRLNREVAKLVELDMRVEVTFDYFASP